MPDSLSNITNNTQNLPANTPAIDWYYITTLLVIMILTGLLGGYANFLNSPKEERSLMRSLMMGIVATIAIPLFLKVVDSNILNQTKADVINYFVYAGCCVLAAFYSARFLEGLSSRVLQNLQDKVDRTNEVVQENTSKLEENTDKLNQTAEKTDMIMDNQLPDAIPDQFPDTANEEPNSRSIENLENNNTRSFNPQQMVLDVFFRSKTMFQTLDSISKSSGLTPTAVVQLLSELEQAGKIRKIQHRGQDIYTVDRSNL
jgi:predicted transcriptional regulator